MDAELFYSWQSDRDNETCNYLIRDAAKLALKEIDRSDKIEISPRLNQDTAGIAGMPDITATILEKIDRAHFYLADLTFVSIADAKIKKLPNPNVMFEFGYAVRSLGWDRIVCVMNEYYGDAEEQIFNIKSRRFPVTYTLPPGGEIKSVKIHIKDGIKRAVVSMIDSQHKRALEVISRLDNYCFCFILNNSEIEKIAPPPPGQFSRGGYDTEVQRWAIDKLLGYNMILCNAYIVGNELKCHYTWTYFGRIVINMLIR